MTAVLAVYALSLLVAVLVCALAYATRYGVQVSLWRPLFLLCHRVAMVARELDRRSSGSAGMELGGG